MNKLQDLWLLIVIGCLSRLESERGAGFGGADNNIFYILIA